MEEVITYTILISVVGIVLVLILRELDIFTGDVIDSVANVPSKLGSSVANGFTSLFGWLWKSKSSTELP